MLRRLGDAVSAVGLCVASSLYFSLAPPPSPAYVSYVRPTAEESMALIMSRAYGEPPAFLSENLCDSAQN